MTSEQLPAQATSTNALQLADELQACDLVGVLESADTLQALSNWIHQETGAPRAIVRIVLKLIAPLVSLAASRGSKMAAESSVRALNDLIQRFEPARRIADALLGFARRHNDHLKAKHALTTFIHRHADSASVDFAKSLPASLQLDVLQVERTLKLDASIQELVLALSKHHSPQPQLQLRIFEPSDDTKYFYGSRQTPLFGRETEAAKLNEFLQSTALFSWWAIIGAGGMGKSRLALELCIARGGAWCAGFYSHESHFDAWSDWVPERPTLIVIDYAATNGKATGAILRTLAARQDIRTPIRVLLLDRSHDDTWLQNVVGIGSDRLLANQSMFASPLRLAGLSDDDLWKLVTDGGKGQGVTLTRDSALAAFRNVDPRGTPLVALLVSDAMKSSIDPTGWSLTDAVKHALERDAAKYWIPASFSDKDGELLCLSTVVGGLPVSQLEAPDWPTAYLSVDSYDPAVFRAVTGRDARETIPALEPDIFGEVFVLEHLRPRHSADRGRAIRVMQRAWAFRPDAAGEFLCRTVADFPTHAVLPLLVSCKSLTSGDAACWAYWAKTLIYSYVENGDLEASRALLDELRELQARHPENAELADEFAMATTNYLHGLGVAKQFDQARVLYAELAGFAGSHSQSLVIAHALITAVFNMHNDHVLLEPRSHSEFYLATLRTLARTSDCSAYAVDRLARALMYEVRRSIRKGDPASACTGLAALAQLAVETKSVSAIRNVTEARLYLAADFVRRELPRSTWRELVRIEPQIPQVMMDRDIARLAIAILRGLAVRALRRNDIAEGRRLLSYLTRCTTSDGSRHPARTGRAVLGAVVIQMYAHKKEVVGAQRLFNDLWSDSATCLDDADWASVIAASAVNISALLNVTSHTEGFDALEVVLQQLVRHHRWYERVATCLGEFYYNKSVVYGRSGDPSVTAACVVRAKELADARPDMRSLFVEAIGVHANLAKCYVEIGDLDAALATFRSFTRELKVGAAEKRLRRDLEFCGDALLQALGAADRVADRRVLLAELSQLGIVV